MNPRNFPTRVLRRKALANIRAGIPLNEAENAAVLRPKDIRIRRYGVDVKRLTHQKPQH